MFPVVEIMVEARPHTNSSLPPGSLEDMTGSDTLKTAVNAKGRANWSKDDGNGRPGKWDEWKLFDPTAQDLKDLLANKDWNNETFEDGENLYMAVPFPIHVKLSDGEENNTFHLRFMERGESKPPSTSDEPVESSTDYDTHPDTDTENPRVQMIPHLGHFVLSFNEAKSPEMPHIGWRVGRGSKNLKARNVDLLLAKPGDNLSKTLASIHMIFRFNQSSGFLMLRGGSRKAPVEFMVDGEYQALKYDEEQLMYQRVTMVRAGACEYKLHYTIEEKDREIYFRQRDTFLSKASLAPVEQQVAFQSLPGDSCVLRGRYLEYGTQGSGTFGWITRGLDTKTGNPIAIKEIRINGSRSRSDAIAEVQMGKQFANRRGLLPILNASCEHGRPEPCSNMEKFYIYMPYAKSDFSNGFWTDPELPQTTKLCWLKQPLEGLRELHTMGIMHRDIRPKNTLVLSLVPARAALCDYGKAVKAESSTDTKIGPIYTLAPEVWTATTMKPYTANIDAWAYGYAIAEILIYPVIVSVGYGRITPNHHATISAALNDYARKSPDDEPLVDLVLKLLRWEPADRWSAEQALQHRCWESIAQKERDAAVGAESINVKRALSLA
ncbi:hypothetical protein MMC13_003475 [Lambiella insularis]|nr:hypothetical protein [Lambiella insularis]